MNTPSTKPLAWITGAGGLIGSALVRVAPLYAPSRHVRPLTRACLDLSDFAAVTRLFRTENPSLIIHCAALSKSPDCEARPQLARTINVVATAHLASLAEARPFIFFSTDLVFDGSRGNYDETSAPKPLNVYAETKVAAEQLVLANPKHTVIRTSLNGGVSPTGDRGFNELLELAFTRREKLTLFTDEFRSPIAAECTARAVWELTAAAPGLYHVAGSEKLSRWEIGQILAARWPQLNPKLQPASLKSYSGPPRSPDTTLECAKAQRLLSFGLPRFSEWLAAQPAGSF